MPTVRDVSIWPERDGLVSNNDGVRSGKGVMGMGKKEIHDVRKFLRSVIVGTNKWEEGLHNMSVGKSGC